MHLRPYEPTDRLDVERLLQSRHERDGIEALSEHKASRIGAAAAPGAGNVVVVDAARVVGYAQAASHRDDSGALARIEVEIVTDPDLDEVDAAGVRDLLVDATMAIPPRDLVHTVWAWRPGDVEAVTRHGLVKERSLLEMHRALPVERAWTAPEGIVIRPFRRHRDEDVWIEVNRRAFAGHPENGALDRTDLEDRIAKPWFDAEGFLLAWDNDTLLGFCWTKLHPDRRGEIYIVGVAPEGQGRGLGTVLALAALDDLAERQGATTAHLYVEGENKPAVAFYQALGFTTRRELGEYAARR